MPVLYSIDGDKRLVRTRCVGQVTLEEVVDHFRTLVQDPDCPSNPDVFLDLSEMEATSAPMALQVSRVVLEVKRIQSLVQFGACAILAPVAALFGMMRMFETMAEPYFRTTRTFRDRNEAEQWLSVQQLGRD